MPLSRRTISHGRVVLDEAHDPHPRSCGSPPLQPSFPERSTLRGRHSAVHVSALDLRAARPSASLAVGPQTWFGRSRTARSPCWRRSPTRPSSPSRTPGCSRSWSSATPSFRRATARSPRRWSSRRRPPRCCGSSPPRRPTSSACSSHRRERRAAVRGATTLSIFALSRATQLYASWRTDGAPLGASGLAACSDRHRTR